MRSRRRSGEVYLETLIGDFDLACDCFIPFHTCGIVNCTDAVSTVSTDLVFFYDVIIIIIILYVNLTVPHSSSRLEISACVHYSKHACKHPCIYVCTHATRHTINPGFPVINS